MKIICINVLNINSTYNEKGINVIDLDNPWAENYESDIENFSLNVENEYKLDENIIKKYNKNNVDFGTIKILIENLKENFDYMEVSEFNPIDKDIKKETGGEKLNIPPSIADKEIKIKGGKRDIDNRKGILNILGANPQEQDIFFEKYKDDIDQGLNDLIKYGINKKSFDNLIKDNSNSVKRTFEQNKAKGSIKGYSNS